MTYPRSRLRQTLVGFTYILLTTGLLSACGGSSSNGGGSSSVSQQSSLASSGGAVSSSGQHSSSSQHSSGESVSSADQHSSLSSSSAESSSSAPAVLMPTAFSFDDVTDAEPGSEHISNTVEITGITVPVAVTVENGEYQIDEGEFTAAEGTITAGQTLTLRANALATLDATQVVTVYVGEGSAEFAIRTLADTTAPTASVVFPGLHSATDQENLRVRGTAADDLSEIASVTVLVGQGGSVSEFPAESEDGFATWTAEVTLAPGENTLTVSVTDAADNTAPEAAQAVIYQQGFGMAFPDNDVPIVQAHGLVWDEAANRVLILDNNTTLPDWHAQILAVDLATGKRSLFSDPTVPNGDNVILVPYSMVLDQPRNRLLVAGFNISAFVFSVDLVSGERTILSGSTIPNNQQPAFSSPRGIAIDQDNPGTAYMVSPQGNRGLMRLNLETGEREVVSSVPSGDPTVFQGAAQLVVKGNAAYVIGNRSRPLIKVDIVNGERELMDTDGYPQLPGSFGPVPVEIFANSDMSTLLIIDAYGAIFTFDTNTETWSALHIFSAGGQLEFGGGFYVYLHWNEVHNTLTFVHRVTQGVYLMDLENFSFVTLSKSGELPDDENPEGAD